MSNAQRSKAILAVGPAGVSPADADSAGRMPAGPTGWEACATIDA